jgi:hypothetical protein
MEPFPVRTDGDDWLVFIGFDGRIEMDCQQDAEPVARTTHIQYAELCEQVAATLDRVRPNTLCARGLLARAASIKASIVAEWKNFNDNRNSGAIRTPSWRMAISHNCMPN